MQIKVIKAATMKEALERVKTELGANAAILQTRKYKSGGVMGIGGQEMIEVTAAIDDEEPPAKPEPKTQPPVQPIQQIPSPTKTESKPPIPAIQPKPKPIPEPESKPDNYFAGPIVEDEDEDDEIFENPTPPPPPPPESKPVVETQPIPKPRPKISIKVPPKIQIPGQKPVQQTQPNQSTQSNQPNQSTPQTSTTQPVSTTPKPVQPIKPPIPKITVPQTKTETPKPTTIAPKKFTIPTKSPIPTADSTVESKSEVKDESKSETTKTESKVESQVESKTESKTESKSKRGIEMSETPSDFDLIKEIKPLDETEEDLEHPEEVAKIEQTDESKSESKSESKTESKTESNIESKPEVKDESKTETPKTESKSDSKDESKIESKSESKLEDEIKKPDESPEPLEKEFIGMPLPRFQQLKRFLPPKTPKSIGALPAINVKVISNDPAPPKIESKIEPAKIAPAKIESKSDETSKIPEIPTMPRDDESPIKSEGKIETPLSAEQRRIRELEKELADMKDLLKKFTSEHDSPRKENLTLNDVLQSQEIDENLIKEFSERSRQGVLLEDNRSDNAKQALSTFIGQIMDFSQGIKLNRNGVRIAALIGPTGVGKTTTLAKIAAKFVLEKNAKTALITADTYRISAVEQIKTYSDILGLPLEIVYSPMELARAIRRHSDKNLILIDTAGRSHFNRDQMRELQDFLKISPYIERHLVVSATTKKRDAADIIEKFSVCNPNRLVLTKTDETSSTGALLDLLREKNIPLSYITHGQSVPDDILPASPDSMADVLLSRINDDAFDTDYKF